MTTTDKQKQDTADPVEGHKKMDNPTAFVKTSKSKPRIVLKRSLFLLVAVFMLGTVMIVLDQMDNKQLPVEKNNTSKKFSKVSFMEIHPDTYAASITVMAEAQARWKTMIKSFVRGEVVYISSLLIEGARVKKGEVLLKVQDSAYRTAVAEARNRVRRAEVNLLQVQRLARQARRNWHRSGIKGKPDSLLALHEPQLKAAQEELEAAGSVLENTLVQLEYTRLKAPYHGIITRKFVNPGEAVEIGQQLVEIMDTQTLDIPVMLDEKQWQLLTPKWQGASAQLSGIHRNQTWIATMERVAGQIERETRQRRLFLSYRQPHVLAGDHLLPGEFIRVELPGRTFDNLLRVPQSALTRDGFVWFIDTDNKLQRYRTQPVFGDQHFFYLPTPIKKTAKKVSNKNIWRIAVTPLSGFIPGSRILPHPISLNRVSDTQEQ